MELSGDNLRSKRDLWLASAIGLCASLFIIVPAWQLLFLGPFRWHVAQPAYWQGGIEALCVVFLLGAIQLLSSRRARIILCLLVAELYLRRHAADASAVIDLVYFEFFVGLGAAVALLAGLRRPECVTDYLTCFVLGVSAWSAVAWTTSALGWGSVRDLRWLTLLLLIPTLVMRPRPWIVQVERHVAYHPARARFCAGVLFACFLIQFARSDSAIGFDGLWYGLRGEYVLVGSGSVFASEGLVSPVFYFPKFYELLLIPVSALGSSTAIVGMTILIGTLLGATVYEMLRRLSICDSALRYLIVALCLSTPAVAAAMLDPKGDILAAALIGFAWLKAAEFIDTRSSATFLWMSGLLLLATQARLSAVPFAMATFLSACAAAFLNPNVNTALKEREQLPARLFFFLALIITAFVTARTLVLTGVPTIGPDPLFNLWLSLGYRLHLPAGTLRRSYPKDWHDIAPLVFDLLFRPQVLRHIVITWTGNIWIWCGVLALLLRISSRQRPSFSSYWIIGSCLIVVSFTLMLLWGYQVRGGDGNYFIAGLIPALILSVAALYRATKSYSIANHVLVGTLIATLLFQCAYGFASAAWTPGTRSFDLNFDRNIRSFKKREENLLEYYGIAKIAQYLRHHQGVERVTGDVAYEPGLYLPARFENLADISFSYPNLVANPERFVEYMKSNGIRFFIVPHETINDVTTPTMPISKVLAARFSTDPSITVIKDRNYDMYDMSQLAQ